MRAVEFITEAFNQPYPLQWEPGDNGDYDALATLGDGKYLSIMFNHEGDNEWHVEFWRNNSVGVTGEGDAQRVFATVLSAMQQFIQKQQPKRIVFSANKDVEPGQNSESRAKLYNSLVARYARAWGYDASNQDHGHEVIYELTRLKQEVTELFNPKDSLRLRWDNTFGPVERHAQARFDDNWLDISFVPSNEKGDVVEIAFARNDRWDVSGEGDEYKIFSTVIQAIREYLMSYQPKILYFSSKGQSRTRLYQSLINRLAQSYGYKQFDINKLSPEAKEKLGLIGSDILVLRKSYDQQGITEAFPQPGESSGKAKQFNPNAKVQTKEMTLDQILSTVKGIPYVNNVIDDWDAKDYSWNVTKKVIEYAQYLQKNPQSVANLPPLVVIDGRLDDGAHRLSAINLLQKRMDSNNPLWKQVKLKVQFGASADVVSEQDIAEGTADDINKMFGNMFDPNYAALQRVALLAMQGRQDEAMSHLSRVIKDADPNAQKKIISAVNDIKPVTINGKIADSSVLDKSKQHQEWIQQKFIPWVESVMKPEQLDEMPSAMHEDIPRIMKQKGYKLISSGQDAYAFLEPGTGKVLKIFGTKKTATGLNFSKDQQMFFAWAKYCMENANNPFLVKFDGFEPFQYKGHNYVQIRQERLFNIKYRVFDAIESMEDSIHEHNANYAMWHIMEAKEWENELRIIKNPKLLFKTLDTLIKMAESQGYTPDLHQDNIMQRKDGTPVIMDPWWIPEFSSTDNSNLR